MGLSPEVSKLHQLHFFLGLFKWWQKHHDLHSLGRLGCGNAQLICSLVSHLTRIYLPVNYTFLNPTVIGSRFGQIKPRAIIFWGELWVKHTLESHWLQTTFSQSVLSCLATLAALGGRVDKADTAPLWKDISKCFSVRKMALLSLIYIQISHFLMALSSTYFYLTSCALWVCSLTLNF